MLLNHANTPGFLAPGGEDLSGGAGVMLCNIWAMTQLSGLGGTEWAHFRQLPNFPEQSFWCGVCGVRAMP